MSGRTHRRVHRGGRLTRKRGSSTETERSLINNGDNSIRMRAEEVAKGRVIRTTMHATFQHRVRVWMRACARNVSECVEKG